MITLLCSVLTHVGIDISLLTTIAVLAHECYRNSTVHITALAQPSRMCHDYATNIPIDMQSSCPSCLYGIGFVQSNAQLGCHIVSLRLQYTIFIDAGKLTLQDVITV